MQILRRVDRLRSAVSLLRGQGGHVALVPTMGALHAGHMQLVKEAKQRADHVVVSIFVNPKQFGANEDLDAYPRQEDSDAAMLSEAGVAILWAPDVEQVYPQGFATNISVAGVSEGLCGAARPGHFDGVATVVAKLFNQVQPDMALFGEKDYQQLAVIRAMARDLNFGLDIIGVPTVRDADGLALSSRNAYLSSEKRAAAAMLPRAMQAGIAVIEAGGPVRVALDGIEQALAAAGFGPIDYVTLADAVTLEPLDHADRPARLLVAARLGRTRLIDNMPVKPAGM
ncbi:MAG: pantoate--beta-alanine ligase [Blastomonas sp.]|nr:pantoate--beta-alanine ligase [Blastomonas sp.]